MAEFLNSRTYFAVEASEHCKGDSRWAPHQRLAKSVLAFQDGAMRDGGEAYGAVMGMDWHSSGITTSVLGALKRGMNPRFSELSLMVCGGRGRHSVRTPDELRAFSQKTGLDGDTLARTSRLTARIDNNAVADGFQLYLHSFVITQSGEWAVVQQGMNPDSHLARRYHWHSASVRDFVSAPHTAIVGQPQGEILNLVDTRAAKAQNALLTIAKGPVTAPWMTSGDSSCQCIMMFEQRMWT
jgi:uncharacterized protein